MPRKKSQTKKSGRRVFTKEFKSEAVQMLLDGYTASSVAKRLGLSNTNLLYRWKQQELLQSGPVASTLEVRVRELEIETPKNRGLDIHPDLLVPGAEKINPVDPQVE